MKNLIILLITLGALNGFAQKQDTTATQKTILKDTVANDSELKIFKKAKTIQTNKNEMIIIGDNSDSLSKDNFSEFIILSKNGYRKNTKALDVKKNYNTFKGHWRGFRYGFINFANNDYSMYSEATPHFMDLDRSNSFAMQFNLFQHSINFVPTNNFGLITGIGLEYQRLRFENKYTSIIENEDGIISPLSLKEPELKDIKKNSLKILYLTIPLMMEVQFPVESDRRVYISGGFVAGVRIHSKTKIVYKDEDGDKQKRKNTDNFNIIPFKADVVGSIGYRYINVWGSYTLTHLFKNNQGPQLNPYIIGMGFLF
ncbi:MAG: outer membrane beta-barrel protein [Odoribacter sp.]